MHMHPSILQTPAGRKRRPIPAILRAPRLQAQQATRLELPRPIHPRNLQKAISQAKLPPHHWPLALHTLFCLTFRVE
ncbi:uncharacterized protein TrAFT101_001599 [Trichoderma asperellum]|uniref:uncharacterized protein n=1 Tax=Trichoderma asperellum TaxID=101201 RepID=UPI00331B69D1|nr:hypothetical protein TrAFT101_001599 [Trichoderma asperellum]